MRGTRINREKTEMKEKAFAEFNQGHLTQRDLARKYKICETELSRFFTSKLSNVYTMSKQIEA